MELADRKITSLNVEETQRIAAALAEVVVPGTVIALEGDCRSITSICIAWKTRSSLKISHSMTMSKPMG